jgi:integrase/recombinase XerD
MPGDPTDPDGFPRLVDEFCDWMGARGYSERTIESRWKAMAQLAAWLAERGVSRPAEVTKPMLDRYQRWLFHYRRPNGKPLTFRTQSAKLVPVRSFFKWAARDNRILYNPASELELPRVERTLPKAVLTAAEAEKVMAQPDLTEAAGIRDRAILEVFYSTGVRRMELADLLMFDLDTERHTLLVRQGKGRKDRIVPIGERAVVWCEKWMHEIRPQWSPVPDDGFLFIAPDGDPLSGSMLTTLVRRYITAADIAKRGSCHLLRHTMATLMLEGGADIRWIQAMLGHSDISTTQIYTKVSVRQLQAVHTLTHPGAGNVRHRDPATAELFTEAGVNDPAEFHIGPRLSTTASQLLAAVDSEADLENRPRRTIVR